MTVQLPPQARFIRLLATRLHEYGTAAHRLEGAVSSVAAKLGLRCDVFSTPTSVFLAFREMDDPAGTDDAWPTQLIRLKPGNIDVAKLCEVDAIAEEVTAGTLDLAEGTRRLLAVPDSPPVAPLWGQLLAWGVIGGTVASLLGSTWADVGAAAVLATLTGLLALRWGRGWQEAGSFEPIAAFVVTTAAYAIAAAVGGGTVPNIVIGALIILMPGLDLTVAITELSTGHLASGTARFAGAMVVLLKLSLGVMLATQGMQWLGFADARLIHPDELSPAWFTWIAVVATAIAFAVLFNTLKRDWLAVLVAAMTAYTINYFARQYFGSEFGVFLAALVVASMSNLYGRTLNRPASIMRLPGIILLVPGSLGYRALTFLFSRNIEEGINAAISVTVVLAALVGGLLLGNTLVAPRRSL